MFNKVVNFIKELYPNRDFIPLHEPKFIGNEKKYVVDCIDSTFVSSVGSYVTKMEEKICEYSGAKYAVATVNGTAALHVALLMAGVDRDDEVITQALTFVATANAISYTGAKPIFLDVDKETLGLSPDALKRFLESNCNFKNGYTYNKKTGKKISACVPMHTFGAPARIDEIVEICKKYNIKVVEDAAESIGSIYKGKMTGRFGDLGIYSFNGNKTITGGAGGVIVTDNKEFADKAKRITTTAKLVHKWEFVHDMIAYNYRMTNINAALLVAQLENIDKIIANKRETADIYTEFFKTIEDVEFFVEPEFSKSNYWLNALILEDKKTRDDFLEFTNSNGVMTRPIWRLMSKLDMYKDCQKDDLKNSLWLEDRVVNIPSSARF